MKQRLPIVLSATALVVALFGSTPLGHAVATKVPPFATKAGYATKAGNAAAVNGIKAAKTPKPGFLVPLGADGKFPATVARPGPTGPPGTPGDRGAQGPKGDPGAKGDTGARGNPGLSGHEVKPVESPTDSSTSKRLDVLCAAGKKAIGGGVSLAVDEGAPVSITWSTPVITSGGDAVGWSGHASETAAYNGSWTLYAVAICATVGT